MKRYKLTKKDRELLAFTLTVKGPQQQLAKASEELQELGQVLTKILGDSLVAINPAAHPWEAIINHPAAAKVHAELADVELLLHQVRRIFGPAPEKCYRKKLDALATEMGRLQLDKYQAESRMHRQHTPVRPRVHIMGPFGTDDLKGVLESKSDILDAMRYATSLLDPVLEVGPKAASVWADAIKKYYQEKEKKAAPSYIEQLLADHSASYLEEFKKKHGGKDREPLGVPFTSADTVAAQLDKINKDFFNIWADREKAKSTAPKYVPVPAHRLRPGDVVKIKKGLEFTAKLDKVEPAYDCIQGRIMRLYYTMQDGMPAKGNVIKARHHTVDVLAFKDHAGPDQVLQDLDTETTDMLVPAKRLQIGDVVQLPNQATPVTLTFVEVRDQEVGLYFASGQYWAAPLRKIHTLQLHDQPAPAEKEPVRPAYDGPTTKMLAYELRTGHKILLHGEVETVYQVNFKEEDQPRNSELLDLQMEAPIIIRRPRQQVHVNFVSGHVVIFEAEDELVQVLPTVETAPEPEKRHLLRAVQLAPGTIVKHPRTGQSILVATRAIPIGQSPANFKVHYLGGDNNFNTVDVGQLPSLELQGYVVLADVLAQDITTGHIIVHPDHKELVKITDVRPAPGDAPQNILIISHRAADMAVCSEDRSLRLPSLHTVQRVTAWPF